MKRSLVKTLIFFTITLMISAISQMLISATSNICISGSSIEIEKGTTKASITIDVSNNPGIAILGFDIGYDAENLDLTSVIVSGEVFSNSDVTAGDISKNPYVFSAFTATDDITKNGLLVTLEFAINPNCQSGIYAITLTNGEAYNINEQTIGIEFVNGKITIKPEKTYTVNYDANGGSNAPASQTKIHDVALALNNEIPTKEGYTFMGWATSKNGSVAYAPGASFTTNADTTLYAVWKLDAVSVAGVTLDKTTATMTEGESLTLTATVAPSNATNKNVTWTSSDTSVATVSNGVVTAKSAGTATITVITADGSKKATCAITVNTPTIDVVKLEIANVTGTCGEIADVSVRITENPGFAALVLEFYYDNTKLKFDCLTCKDPLFDFFPNDNTPGKVIVVVLYYGGKDYEDIGEFFVLKFDVLEDAPNGEYSVSGSVTDGTNEHKENLLFEVTSGSVTVKSPEFPDTSADVLLYTEAPESAVLGSEFTFDISLAGTYDGYAIVVPKQISGLSIYKIEGESGVNVDDFGDAWLISIIGGLGMTNSEKDKIATAYVSVAMDATLGETTLSLDADTMITNNAGDIASVEYNYAAINITKLIPGDINGDGIFNYSDVSKLYAIFRKKSSAPEDVDTDINGDGKFNYSDVSKLYAIFRKKATFS